MTENADVEWLRAKFGMCLNPLDECPGHERITCGYARRLLAHIDQLEAEAAACRSNCEDLSVMVNAQQDRRPSVHEIAANLYIAAMTAFIREARDPSAEADMAYKLAEALVAEGRRWDEK